MNHKRFTPVSLFSSLAVAAASALMPIAAAQAGPSTFSYEGRIFDSGGNPATGNATFTLRIYAANGTCILYEEGITAVSDLTAGNGYFSVSVGSGTATSNYAGRTLATIFSNRSPLSGYLVSGSTCSYTPNPTDGRSLEVVVNLNGTSSTMAPKVTIGTSPFSMMADDSNMLSGLPVASFLQVDNSSVTQSNLATMLSGTSSLYAASSSAKGTVVTQVTGGGTPSSATGGSLWYDVSSNTMKYFNGSTAVTLSTAGASGVSSVGLSLPTNIFSVTVPTVTSTGNLTAGLTNQAANTVLAGPSSGGGSSTPTFRSLVAADVTGLDGTYLKQGGNSFGTSASFGTNDSNSMTLKTANTARIFMSGSGTVGIGTIAPSFPLDVNGPINSNSVVMATGGFFGNYSTGSSTVKIDASAQGIKGTVLLGPSGSSVGIGTAVPMAVLDVYGTGAASALVLPRDSSANRPTGTPGMIRFNTTTSTFEGYGANGWVNFSGGAGVAPSITGSCTNGTVSTNSNSTRGTVNIANTNSSCVLTFAANYPVAPTCVVSWQTAPTPVGTVLTAVASQSSLSISYSTTITGGAISYICMP